MFQSFDTLADPTLGAPRLARLREEIALAGLDGFLVPRADEFQGEYVPPSAERLHWLTGFSGSAGVAVALKDRAAILSDGRYTLQIRAEVDTTAFTPVDGVETPVHAWLAEAVSAGMKIGFDPWLHTRAQVRRLVEALAKRGAEAVAVAENLVDRIWTDRPAPPLGRLSAQPLAFAGEDVAAKIARIAAELTAEAFLLTQPDSIAWLFNVRGRDVAHNPVPHAFALLPKTGRPILFVDPAKLDDAVRAHLAAHVDVAPRETLLEELDAVGHVGARVALDAAATPEILVRRLEAAGAEIVEAEDPVILPKACKNAAEIEGARAAHRRDGAALAKFLAWFDAEGHTSDEIACCEKLEACRAETGELVDLSFGAISGAGPNGAIVHYHATRATNRKIEPDSLFLLDSGGQYRDGTTDVTRTLAVGAPSAEMRRCFTLVLKGHLALANARFPVGTTGVALDALARIALWRAGLDYDHGTGHGVGSFLSVHEGPQRISKTGTVALKPGMILSNEPGYYRTGEFGIRIENLEIVTPAAEIAGGERPMLGFETLTLVPIDVRLVDVALLDRGEIAALDAYHARVRAEIGPLLDPATRDWLDRATAPLSSRPLTP
ncbi:MAG: aminopeptidase P family protein [Hyphomicrobiales bacterium]|nr:aminopeptidase P family protein [Hyphomicrobiales bacterium]